MTDSTLVLQGSLDEDSIDEVLGSLSLSRSCLRLELDGPPAASALLKSGQVLHAEAAAAGEGTEAFRVLLQNGAGRYRVFRQASPPSVDTALGTLAELIDGADRRAVARRLLLAGPASPDELKQVLEVMSLSRQRLELRLDRADGSLATVVCKAGLVVAASIEPDGDSGISALGRMLAVPAARYALSRAPTDGPLRRPFGSLAALRDEVTAPSRDRKSRRNSVIRGDFSDQSFRDLLHIITASRQVLEITLLRGGEWHGMVLAKAGRLLDARTGSGDQGIRAFEALLAHPGDAFDVVLSRRPVSEGAVLGDLRELAADMPQGAQARGPATLVPTDDDAEEVTQVARAPRATASGAMSPGRLKRSAVSAPDPQPTAPAARPDADARLAEVEERLARQSVALERLATAAQTDRQPYPSAGLLLAVLFSQFLVGAMLVLLIALMVFR